jgi:hypothetical protein
VCDKPERARAVGAAYWQARVIGKSADQLIKAYLYEDWIVQRVPSGESKFVLYINACSHPLRGAALIDPRQAWLVVASRPLLGIVRRRTAGTG